MREYFERLPFTQGTFSIKSNLLGIKDSEHG